MILRLSYANGWVQYVATWQKWKEHKWRFKESSNFFRGKSDITKVRFQHCKIPWIQSWRYLQENCMMLAQKLTKSRTISRSMHRRSTTLTRDCYLWRDILGITIWDSTISQIQQAKIVLQSSVISLRVSFNCNQALRTPTGSAPDQFWLSFCTDWNTLELSRRGGIYVMVCVFHTIWYGKTVKRRNNWHLLWAKHLKLGKDLDFIMASYTLTVRYIRLEMFEQYALLYTCKSHPKYLHSFIVVIVYLKLFTANFR